MKKLMLLSIITLSTSIQATRHHHKHHYRISNNKTLELENGTNVPILALVGRTLVRLRAGDRVEVLKSDLIKFTSEKQPEIPFKCKHHPKTHRRHIPNKITLSWNWLRFRSRISANAAY